MMLALAVVVIFALLFAYALCRISAQSETREERMREPNKGYPGDMAVLVGCVIALLVDTIIGAPL